jgi:type IV pilus assembly protein PilB
MQGAHRLLGEILVAHRVLKPKQLAEAIELQKRTARTLGSLLLERGWVTPSQLISALAVQRGVGAWHLDQDAPDPKALRSLPEHVCRQHKVLPVRLRGDLLTLAMRDPDDIETIELVRTLTGCRIEPVLAAEDQLTLSIEASFGQRGIGTTAVTADGLIKQALKEATAGAARGEGVQVLSEEDTRPVVGLVNQILTDAVRTRASDVHLEPRSDGLDVRFRIDGDLVKVMEVPAALIPMLTTRIKIMADVDIVEYRLPQDGRISASVDERDIDMRVSVLPNVHGQRIVLRILDRSMGLRRMDELGLTAHGLSVFRSLVKRPYGILLVTGPTGSGKTTTLYSALSELTNGQNNVMTCEDPVEYDIAGVNQSQVNEKVGLTFAEQLKAILRQDPDIVLVGEIRDEETAQTAVRASMTGHLVLSTLHTNDAPSAVARLTDIGVDPSLLSASLIGVLAQRLVRVLCPHCREQSEAAPEEAEALYATAGRTGPVWRAVGCPRCHGTGYSGRLPIHEVMRVTRPVSSAIAAGATVEQIREVIVSEGFQNMAYDAALRVLDGTTSFEEASRVVVFDAPVPGLRLVA